MGFFLGGGLEPPPHSWNFRKTHTWHIGLHRLRDYTVYFLGGILQSRIWNKYSLLDCKFIILSLIDFTKREIKLMLFIKRFGKFSSRLVKLLRERVVKLQYGNEYFNIYSWSGIAKLNKKNVTMQAAETLLRLSKGLLFSTWVQNKTKKNGSEDGLILPCS